MKVTVKEGYAFVRGQLRMQPKDGPFECSESEYNQQSWKLEMAKVSSGPDPDVKGMESGDTEITDRQMKRAKKSK